MADTHKVKVLLTAEAGRLRRELQSSARGTQRLGQSFAGAAGKGDAMAKRAGAAAARTGNAMREARGTVRSFADAFPVAGRRAGDLAGRTEAAGERVEGAMREARGTVRSFADAFPVAGRRAGDLAGRTEAAGERVEGAMREARGTVRSFADAFPVAGRRAGDLAGRTEAAGERVEGAMREARAETRRLGTTFGQVGTRGNRVLGRLGTGLSSLAGAFGLATGAFAVGAVARQVASLETRMERLGIQSGRSREEMAELRAEIYEVANAPDIRVDPSQLTSAVEAIVEKTGDLDFARQNLRLLAESIQGSGGTGDALGRLAAEMRKLGVISDDEVAGALNLITAQGKSGAFTLGNMAAQGERLFSAFSGLGYEGPGAVRELGAIAQVARQATGSSEQATTAVEALLRSLADAQKLQKLEELGVWVRRDDGSYRELSDILSDTVEAVGGDMVALSEIFDAEAIRVFNALASARGQSDYQRFLGIRVAGDELAKDAARIADTTEAAAQDIRTSFEAKFAELLTSPLSDASTAIVAFKGEIAAAGGAIATMFVAYKAAQTALGLAGRLGRGGTPRGPGLSDAFGDGADARSERPRGGGRNAAARRLGTMRVGTLYAGKTVGMGGGRGGGVVATPGGGTDTRGGRGGSLAGRLGRGALRALPVVGTGLFIASAAIEIAKASGVNFEELLTFGEKADPATEHDPVARRRLNRALAAEARAEADAVAPPVLAPVHPSRRGKTGGVCTNNSRINVTVNTRATHPRLVAREVADELERRQADELRRVESAMMVDDTTEIYY